MEAGYGYNIFTTVTPTNTYHVRMMPKNIPLDEVNRLAAVVL